MYLGQVIYYQVGGRVHLYLSHQNFNFYDTPSAPVSPDIFFRTRPPPQPPIGDIKVDGPAPYLPPATFTHKPFLYPATR